MGRTSDSTALGNARKSDVAVELVRGDQLGLARVPLLEHLCGRGASENAWMDEAGKLDVRNVSAGAVDAFKIPDCFGAGDVLAHQAGRIGEVEGPTYAEG